NTSAAVRGPRSGPARARTGGLSSSVQSGGLVEQVVEGVDFDVAVWRRDEFARAVRLPSPDPSLREACYLDPPDALIGKEKELEAGRLGVQRRLLTPVDMLSRGRQHLDDHRWIGVVRITGRRGAQDHEVGVVEVAVPGPQQAVECVSTAAACSRV